MTIATYTPTADRVRSMPESEMDDEKQRSMIALSQQRSRAFGIESGDEPDFSRPNGNFLTQALDENRFLFQHAAPVMETLSSKSSTPTAWCC